jgi:hypothetical protein
MGVEHLIMRIDIKAAEVCFLRPIYYFISRMRLTSDDGEKFFSDDDDDDDDDDDKEEIGNRRKRIYRLTQDNINIREDAYAYWHIHTIISDDGRNNAFERVDASTSTAYCSSHKSQ